MISEMETLTLFSELEEFENQLRRYDEEEEAPRKKTLALNADIDSTDDSDEEIALLTKRFRNFWLKRKLLLDLRNSSTHQNSIHQRRKPRTIQLMILALNAAKRDISKRIVSNGRLRKHLVRRKRKRAKPYLLGVMMNLTSRWTLMMS